jgi:hypothetical protein
MVVLRAALGPGCSDDVFVSHLTPGCLPDLGGTSVKTAARRIVAPGR